jgi:hypothetical protein
VLVEPGVIDVLLIVIGIVIWPTARRILDLGSNAR